MEKNIKYVLLWPKYAIKLFYEGGGVCFKKYLAPPGIFPNYAPGRGGWREGGGELQTEKSITTVN